MAKRRRTKGTGTLRLRGTRWHGEIDLGTQAEPKVVRSSFRTKRAAEEWLKAMASRRGRDLSDPNAPLVDLFRRWVELHCQRIEPNTQVLLRYIFSVIEAPLANLTLATATPLRLETWLAELQVTAYVRQRTYKSLAQFFKWCVRMGEIPASPTIYVDAPKTDPRKPKPLSEAQVKTLLAAAKDDPYYSFYAVMLTCGLRPGEAFALHWEDVDLAAGSIFVRRSLERTEKGPPRLKDPKTRSSRRTIQLPALAALALENHGIATGRDGHVWKATRGGPIHGKDFARRRFRPLLTASDLPTIRLYDLRHSALTLMLLKTRNVRRTASVAGHSPATLMKTYAHLVDMADDPFMDDMNALFPLPKNEPSENGVQNSVHGPDSPDPENSATDRA